VVKLCEDLQADAAVVAEPTELRAVIASKGVLRLRIVTEGLAAHSSKPMLGINAISHMSRLVLALEVMHQNLSVRQHPLLGPGMLNVGVINGGVQVNFVPDLCTIEVDRRLLPGEKAVDVLLDIQELIENLRVLHPSFNAHIEAPLLLVDEALRLADGRHHQGGEDREHREGSRKPDGTMGELDHGTSSGGRTQSDSRGTAYLASSEARALLRDDSDGRRNTRRQRRPPASKRHLGIQLVGKSMGCESGAGPSPLKVLRDSSFRPALDVANRPQGDGRPGCEHADRTTTFLVRSYLHLS
jgi:hypothetical protein